MKLYLDPGHGGTDPGAQGNGLNEKDITLDIAQSIQTLLLNHYENIDVRMSRTSDITKSLAQRTNEANSWCADYYLAIHINSAESSSAQGYEDYIHSNVSDTKTAAKYREIIHAEVIKLNQLNVRGKKKANFHVLRESNMPAMLSENGFISNPHDASLMKQASWRQSVAQGHANGIAKVFNLKPKSNSTTSPLTTLIKNSSIIYKVIAGSFKVREDANNRVAFLHSKGIEAFVVTVVISDETWYRVQAGAFSSRANAEARERDVKTAGIKDAFIVTQSSDSSPATAHRSAPNPSPTQSASQSTVRSEPTGDSILGPTYLSPEQMNLFAKSVNPDAPELGSYYSAFGEYYGIRGDLAFAQALLETNYFRFTGDVNPEQNNFAGIGATGGGNSGASFKTPKDGVLAQFQHLFAYASTQSLPDKYPLVDPRFNLVPRGSAPAWADLNGKWAVPGTSYGQSILSLYEKMITFAIHEIK
ncbi:N-acetylmuramoyl-L-alanine amidase [Neobacillus terrae]|uniref:N-acetylmuramoyl-L-alanine amidase n=1 Tax=Neobacillus terrae TaxID=3034837 RepID=UPI00140C2EA1|nr:N-acetylmuramoyl-L-alanine amidase [Neobacillus terrae]NHM31450.1 N-acetylmuramoyl-L-alanine amidase [Neobacillus terrae]